MTPAERDEGIEPTRRDNQALPGKRDELPNDSSGTEPHAASAACPALAEELDRYRNRRSA